MFTGLVEEIAVVRNIHHTAHSARISITASRIMEDIALGDSISINGVCLTVTDFRKDWFSVDAVPETMRRTNLRTLKAGSNINVERAMSLGGRFGGHIVSGHIDGVGTLIAKEAEDIAVVLKYETTHDVLRYVVSKGSICVNGVSLTVMDVDNRSFSISVIPHTGDNSTLLDSRVGDIVNLECDVIAKYVEKLLTGATHRSESADVQNSLGGMATRPTKSRVTMDFLEKHGFV